MSTEPRARTPRAGAILLAALATAWPAAAAEVEFRPRLSLGAYRAGNVLVTDATGTGRRVSDEVARLGLDLDLAIRDPASSWNLSFRPATTRHNEQSDLDNTSYRLGADHARTLSSRSSLTFTASVDRTEDQGVREETVADTVTLLPRARIDRYAAALGITSQAGRRSSIAWGVDAGAVRRDAAAGTPLLDDDRLGANLGWRLEASERARYGLDAGYEFYDYSSGADARVLTLGFAGDFTLTKETILAFGAGAGRSASGGESDVRLALDASVTRSVGERSSFSAGVRQGIAPGTGATHATEDRGVFASWRHTRPRGLNAAVLAGAWETETLGIGGDAAGIGARTISTRESIGWAFGRRVTLSLSHAFRRQRARGSAGTGGLDAEPYHDFGLFAVWNIAGR